MGQHSSPSEWHFYRSVIVWFLPWVVIAGVIGVAVWIGVDAIGGDDGRTPIAAQTGTPSPKPSHSTESSPSPDNSPTEKASPTPSESPKSSPTGNEDQELITDGITVQVLNGSSTAGAEQAMADRLEKLGFEIVAVQPASAAYPQTTVFWSFQESKKAAKALAARFGWVAEPKPENLSATVSIHVVVGDDEA
jgi:hypothetical protein